MPGRRILTATSRAHAVVDHHRLVHLGDGGGGDRRAELGEVILEPAAERLLDGAARLGHGERRQPVLQVAQVAGELGADQVGAGGQELAELDVAGAEAGERAGDARAPRGSPARNGQASRRMGSVATRARRSGSGTGVPGGTKRTPCCASTTPGLGQPQTSW